MGEQVCIRANIQGRVQGVFYRDSTQQEAQKIQITGWVKNTAEGNVEALFCGERDAIEQLLTWCHQGPPAADVSQIETSEVPFEQHEQFVIHYD